MELVKVYVIFTLQFLNSYCEIITGKSTGKLNYAMSGKITHEFNTSKF